MSLPNRLRENAFLNVTVGPDDQTAPLLVEAAERIEALEAALVPFAAVLDAHLSYTRPLFPDTWGFAFIQVGDEQKDVTLGQIRRAVEVLDVKE